MPAKTESYKDFFGVEESFEDFFKPSTDLQSVITPRREEDFIPNLSSPEQQIDELSGKLPESSLLRTPMSGIVQGLTRGLGLMARAEDVFDPQDQGRLRDIKTGETEPVEGQGRADEINRMVGILEQAAAQKDQETGSNQWLNRMFRGAFGSIAEMAPTAMLGLGAGPIIAEFALSRGNQALTEASDAGLKGDARLGYATRAAMIEGTITAAFQLAGLGGLESAMGGRAAWNGVKDALKGLGRSTLAEIPEENIIEFLDALNQKLSVVDPNDFTLEEAWQIARDTTAQTILTVGLAQGITDVGKAAAFATRPSRKTFKEAFKSGRPTEDKREEFAEILREQLGLTEEEIQGQTPAPGEDTTTIFQAKDDSEALGKEFLEPEQPKPSPFKPDKPRKPEVGEASLQQEFEGTGTPKFTLPILEEAKPIFEDELSKPETDEEDFDTFIRNMSSKLGEKSKPHAQHFIHSKLRDKEYKKLRVNISTFEKNYGPLNQQINKLIENEYKELDQKIQKQRDKIDDDLENETITEDEHDRLSDTLNSKDDKNLDTLDTLKEDIDSYFTELYDLLFEYEDTGNISWKRIKNLKQPSPPKSLQDIAENFAFRTIQKSFSDLRENLLKTAKHDFEATTKIMEEFEDEDIDFSVDDDSPEFDFLDDQKISLDENIQTIVDIFEEPDPVKRKANKEEIQKEFENLEAFSEDKKRKPKVGEVSFQFAQKSKKKKDNAPKVDIFEQPEMVELVRQINAGNLPKIVERVQSRQAEGLGPEGRTFLRKGETVGGIKLRADIFIGPVIRTGTIRKDKDVNKTVDELLKDIVGKTGLDPDDIHIKVEKDKKTGRTRVTFFEKDPDFAAKVLAHEIGHVVGWLPDATLKRGNILGHVASLKNHLKNFIEESPTKTKGDFITTKDRTRLKKEAKKLLKNYTEFEENIDAFIEKTIGLSPEEAMNFWNVVLDPNDITNELVEAIQLMSTAEKKSIIKGAMEGVVSDEIKQFAGTIRKSTLEQTKGTVKAPESPLRKPFRKPTGRKITGAISKSVKPTSKDIKKKYRELLEAEILKRQLLSKEVMMDELKALTQWWNPFNPKADKDYTAYRHSPAELYAEAISVLLNTPSDLRDRAPSFMQGFFNYIGRKPEVEESYNSIIQSIKNGYDNTNLIKRTLDGYVKGDEIMTESNPFQRTKDPFMRGWGWAIHDVFWLIKNKAKKVRRAGFVKTGFDLVNAIDSAIYSGSEREIYMNMIAGVKSIVDTAGSTWQAFNLYAQLQRVINEKVTKAQPDGWTKKRALEVFAKWKTNNPKEFAALEKAQKALWKTRQDLIVKKIQKMGVFNKELTDFIANNEFYATFNVLKYLESKHGKGDGLAMFKQVGTFESVTEPVTATIMKDLSLLPALNWNNARKQTIKFLQKHHKNEAPEAEKKFKDGRFRLIDPKEKGKDLLTYMEDGELQGAIVDKFISDGFNDTNNKAIEVTSSLTRYLGSDFFRIIFTGVNYGFWAFNIFRDYKRAVKNLPGMRLTSRRFLKLWLQSIGEGFKSTKGILTPETRELLKKDALLSVVDPFGMSEEDTQIERLLKVHLGKGGDKKSFYAPFEKLLHKFLNVNVALERTTKVAANKYLKQYYPDMPEEERLNMIRHLAGSPSFLTKGKAAPVFNNIFLFANPMLQAWRSDLENWGDRPGEVTWKVFRYGILPKVVVLGLSTGVVHAILKTLGFDEEEDVMKGLKHIEKLFRGISLYDMANYTNIPLAFDENGKTIALRFPQDEGLRFIGGTFYKFMTGAFSGLDELTFDLFDYGAGQLPTLTPILQVGGEWLQYFSGINPFDSFRGEKAIPQYIFEAKDFEATKFMIRRSLNQLGIGIIHRFPTSSMDSVKSNIESLVEAPVASNLVNRFVKVSDAGRRQRREKITDQVREEEARKKIKLREISSKQVRGIKLTEEEQKIADDPENERFLKSRTKTDEVIRLGNSLTRDLLFARSQAERDAIHLDELVIDPEIDLFPYIVDDVVRKARIINAEKFSKKDILESVKWLKERNITKKQLREAYKPEIDKLQTFRRSGSGVSISRAKINKRARFNRRLNTYFKD